MQGLENGSMRPIVQVKHVKPKRLDGSENAFSMVGKAKQPGGGRLLEARVRSVGATKRTTRGREAKARTTQGQAHIDSTLPEVVVSVKRQRVKKNSFAMDAH